MTRFDQLGLATALLTLVWCGPSTATATTAAADTPRARITAERAAVDARYRAAEAACRERFVVTPCVDAATAQRRKELAALREQELAIDDAERKQRAALRRSEVAEKQSRLAARAASAPPPAAKASAARPATPASAPPRAAPLASAALDGGPTQAAERAANSAKRQREAQATRERIKAREVRKAEEAKASAAAQKKAAPLPAPSPVPTRPAASAPPR